MLFAHAGFRPLWPVVFFVPFFFMGLAFLRQAMHRDASPAARTPGATQVRSRTPRFLAIGVGALACLAAARAVRADPVPTEPSACASASRQEASALADSLYQKGDYQHAGQCYEAAGDMGHADLAFLKATGPKSEETGRALKGQADAAKALFASVGKAFRGH